MNMAMSGEGSLSGTPVSSGSSVENGNARSLRDELRAVPSIVGRAPDFDLTSAPDEPRGLFLEWLRHAIIAGVPEAHAATLSTVDEGGLPDARVLIVKDVTEDCGFKIATGDESAKGSQLLRNPKCALSFYWSPLARAVRVRGIAQRATPSESAADFRARQPQARAIALAGQQSAVFTSEAARDEMIANAATALEAEPDLASPHWSVWTIMPVSIEFWQGDPSRNHRRLRYLRSGAGWDRDRLWA